MQRNRLFFVYILIFSLLISSCGEKKKKTIPGTGPLKIDITLDKNSYKVGDTIKLIFKLTNTSKEPVELSAKTFQDLKNIMKVNLVRDNVTATVGVEVEVPFMSEVVEEKSLISIKPDEPAERSLFLKINPIRKYSIIPYNTQKLYITLNIEPSDYPENVKSFYTKITGEYKSNELPLTIDSTGYKTKYEQFDDASFSTKFFKMDIPTTDILILKGLRFLPTEEITKEQLAEQIKGYAKVFEDKMRRNVFFEFYAPDSTLMKYARVVFNDKGRASSFVIYDSYGKPDIVYEVIRDDAGAIVRWDKYYPSYIEGKEFFLGYLKTDNDKATIWISELMMRLEDDKFKLISYNKEGSVTKREETAPPVKEIARAIRY